MEHSLVLVLLVLELLAWVFLSWVIMRGKRKLRKNRKQNPWQHQPFWQQPQQVFPQELNRLCWSLVLSSLSLGLKIQQLLYRFKFRILYRQVPTYLQHFLAILWFCLQSWWVTKQASRLWNTKYCENIMFGVSWEHIPIHRFFQTCGECERGV